MLNFRIDPEFFVYPYLVQNSLKPYTQIIDQHFPGGFFLPINFATLGFTTPDSFLRLHVLLNFHLASSTGGHGSASLTTSFQSLDDAVIIVSFSNRP